MMLLPSLSSRVRIDELMDNPSLDANEHARALVGLRRINAWSATAKTVCRAIHDVAKQYDEGQPLRVLDVATGGGDVIVGIAKYSEISGINLECHACDISEQALDMAAGHAAARGIGDQIQFFAHDALGGCLPDDYDVIVSTLFLHHLERDDAVKLLRNMGHATRRGVIICDLDRCLMGFLLCRGFTRCITRSRIVHHDAVVSLHAAFTMNEARSLAADAGLEGATVRRVWPWRWLMQWTKS